MGNLFTVLVVCLVFAATAGAQGVGDDIRVLTNQSISTTLVRKNQENLLKETNLQKAETNRSFVKECYWLGRYQEGLNGLVLSIGSIGKYGSLGAQLHKLNGSLGNFCGINTGESTLEEHDRTNLHKVINEDISKILAEVDAISGIENARGDKLINDARKIETDVKTKVEDLKEKARIEAEKIQQDLKKVIPRLR